MTTSLTPSTPPFTRTIKTPFDALSNALDQVSGSAFDDDGALLGALLDDYILRSLLEDGLKFQAQVAQRDRLRDALRGAESYILHLHPADGMEYSIRQQVLAAIGAALTDPEPQP